MPQSKIIISALVAVIVLGGGYMALKSQETKDAVSQESVKTNEQGTEPKVNETETTGTPSGKKMAFSEFLKQGGAYKCTVNQNIQDTETQGVTYIDGDIIRADYTIEVEGLTMTSSMIVRDGYTYSWSSMAPQMGFKSKIAEAEPTANDIDTGMSDSYAWNADQIGDYNCDAWNPDKATFALPAGVTFTEM